jgi:hypothetical protein
VTPRSAGPLFRNDPRTRGRASLAIPLEEATAERQVLAGCSPGPHRCDLRETTTQTIRAELTVTEAVAAGTEAEVEPVAGMNTLPSDDPPSEVVDDDKSACAGEYAPCSPGVDVHRSNEVARSIQNTDAWTSHSAPPGPHRVAAAAASCEDRDCKNHRNEDERKFHLPEDTTPRQGTSHPEGRALPWASVPE